MKKTLLYTILFTATLANAQMTSSNEPILGDMSTMYVCDSFAVNLDSENGSNATWDYSTLAGYAAATKVVEVKDPATTTYASDFTGATKAIAIGNSMMTYFSSTASDRSSQGFFFNEPSIGDILIKFGTDNMIMTQYPFASGNSFTDDFAGNMEFTYNFYPVNENLTGNVDAEIDGDGTLLLPLGVSIPNVIRYKSVDTTYTQIYIPTIIDPAQDIEIVRVQYEYYDYASQRLPVFIHSTIIMNQVGGGTLAQSALVLSKYPTEGFVGLESNETSTFSIAPNPSDKIITLNGNLNDASASISDRSGKIILTQIVNNGSTLDISNLNAGVYFITINNNGVITTEKIVKL